MSLACNSTRLVQLFETARNGLRECTMVTVDDIANEFQKHHHDSDLLRMLLADLREGRVDLNEFCRRVLMLTSAPVLLATLKGLKVVQILKQAQLQGREAQLASPVRAGNCRPVCRPLRAPAGELWSFQSTVAGPTPPFTASTTAAAASPAAASPAAASPAAAGGYADHAEVHSLKRKVEVLQQANQRLDAENAVIKQKLAGTRVLLDSSAYATQRMLFKRMLLKRVLLERYDRA